jgi:hypothetical protein
MTKEDYIPLNYEDWKHCITDKCGIPLTKEFIEERLVSFNDVNNDYTKKFIQVYGENYTRQIISWFVLAKHEFENK